MVNTIFIVFLHAPQWKIPRAELELAARYLTVHQQPGNWDWTAISRAQDQWESIGLKTTVPWNNALQFLDQLVLKAVEEPVVKLLEWIINKGQFLVYILASPDAYLHLQTLHTLTRFVGEEVLRNPRLTLAELLLLMDQLDEGQIPVEQEQVAFAADGVQLLTAHSSKGLEFDHVFIMDVIKDHWEPNARSGSFTFFLPDTLTFSDTTDAMEARRRLFYVAMTRARRGLYLSKSTANFKGKTQQQAMFWDEVLPAFVEQTTKALPTLQIRDAQQTLLQTPEQPIIAITEDDWLTHRLHAFKLSASALDQYLTCPIGFYYESIIGVPRLNESSSYLWLSRPSSLISTVL